MTEEYSSKGLNHLGIVSAMGKDMISNFLKRVMDKEDLWAHRLLDV